MPKQSRPAQAQPYHHGDLRRALIDTALQLITEEQDWTFSLREVARRAGVSHRAPYNHFPEKLDLLAAIAALGFERLRDGMLRAMAGGEEPEGDLAAIMRTYIRLGRKNPALYRLMFGPALSNAGAGDRPTVAKAAGASARGVLEDVIWRGARSGVFAVSPDHPEDVAAAALSVWSATHGLTMLAVDKVAPPNLSIDEVTERLLSIVVTGLKQASAAQPRRPPEPPSQGEPDARSAVQHRRPRHPNRGART